MGIAWLQAEFADADAKGMAVAMTGTIGVGTKTVLVCDDEPDIRDLYRYAFEDVGYRVDEASNGFDAIERAGQTQPHLVVLDLAMPKLDGFGALPRIREAAPEAEVIVVTAYSTVETFSTGRRLGARACFQKERFIPHIPEVWDRYCS